MRHSSSALLIGTTMLIPGAGGCHTGSSRALVLGHPRGIIATRLSLPGRPHGVSIGASGWFCVSQIDADMVTCGTLTETGASLGPSVHVGRTPAHVSLDPAERFAYTANQTDGTTTIIAVESGEMVGTIPLGDGGFNVLATNARVYLTTAGGVLVIVDAESRKILARIPVGRAANGLAIDETAGVLYVSSRDVGTVTSVDVRNRSIIRSYQVGDGAQRLALSPDRRTLYIATETLGALALEVETGRITSMSGVSPLAVGLALSPDGKRLYVTNPPEGQLQIVDVESASVMATINGLGTPRNVAFSVSGAMALVTDEDGSVIVIR